ncbi:MFS transporter [Microvirga sp. M2]|uniref:MFS transporter n=1 Tax=Microvirga sp. M2 TaxID=3073270 RepID=UPI0039C2B2E2
MDSATKVSATRSEATVFLVAALVAMYAVSQFLRNSIGVIASDLARELSLSATQTGLLSSAFFLTFATVQVPIGILIDRFGPKRIMLATAVIAVAATAMFAMAPSASLLIAARALMGLGCSTFFMAPLVIYARRFPPQRFAGLTSIQMGGANLGTLAATAPLAASAAAIGWRSSFVIVAALTVAAMLVIMVAVPKDAGSAGKRESWGEALKGVASAAQVPSFWRVFFMHLTTYSCFVSIIGLWGGPWLADVHGADLATKGRILLLGAGAQICGMLLWGATDRFRGSYKKPVLIGGLAVVAMIAVLVFAPLDLSLIPVWFILFGLSVSFTPILTSHGKSLFPPHLTGRGITLMNIGTMGGAFLSQSVTGILIDAMGRSGSGGYAAEGYRLVFAALGGWLLLSLFIYGRAIDPHPNRYAPKA